MSKTIWSLRQAQCWNDYTVPRTKDPNTGCQNWGQHRTAFPAVLMAKAPAAVIIVQSNEYCSWNEHLLADRCTSMQGLRALRSAAAALLPCRYCTAAADPRGMSALVTSEFLQQPFKITLKKPSAVDWLSISTFLNIQHLHTSSERLQNYSPCATTGKTNPGRLGFRPRWCRTWETPWSAADWGQRTASVLRAELSGALSAAQRQLCEPRCNSLCRWDTASSKAALGAPEVLKAKLQSSLMPKTTHNELRCKRTMLLFC